LIFSFLAHCGHFIFSARDLIFLVGAFIFPVRRFEGCFADGHFIFFRGAAPIFILQFAN